MVVATEAAPPSTKGLLSPALLAVSAGSLIAHGTAIANYWAVAALWLAWLPIALGLMALAALLALAGAVLAVGDALARRWARVLVAGLVLGLSLVSLATVPFGWLDVLIDFHLLRLGKEALVVAAERGAPPFSGAGRSVADGQPVAYALPPGSQHLALGGEVYLAEAACGPYVFLPTFFGIPDGVGGFLHSPGCARPEDFPGELWGARWTGISPMGGGWYRIDGT